MVAVTLQAAAYRATRLLDDASANAALQTTFKKLLRLTIFFDLAYDGSPHLHRPQAFEGDCASYYTPKEIKVEKGMDALQRRKKVRRVHPFFVAPPSLVCRSRPPPARAATRVPPRRTHVFVSRSLTHPPPPPSRAATRVSYLEKTVIILFCPPSHFCFCFALAQALKKLWDKNRSMGPLGLIPETKKMLQQAKQDFEDADQQRRDAIYTPHIGNIVLATLRCLKTELDAAASTTTISFFKAAAGSIGGACYEPTDLPIDRCPRYALLASSIALRPLSMRRTQDPRARTHALNSRTANTTLAHHAWPSP